MRIFVGNFNEEQLKNGEDKVAIKLAQEKTHLTYIDSKILTKKGKPYLMVVHLTNFF